MSHEIEIGSQVLHGQQSSMDSDHLPAAKPSRRAQNDEKWNSLKGDIYDRYMTQDFTLQDTMRTLEAEHAFFARYIRPYLLHLLQKAANF
jgi:Clr5 domain